MFFDAQSVQLWIGPAIAAFAIGLLLAWLLQRGRLREALGRGRESRDAEVAQLTIERDTSQEALQRLYRDHDASLRELAEQRTRVVALSRDSATLAGRLERLTQIETELSAARAEAKHWNEACQRAEQRLTESATRMQEQVRAAEERQAMLERVREEFADRFKSLAGELLEEKSRKFTEQNQTNLGTLLNPLREQLGEFRKTRYRRLRQGEPRAPVAQARDRCTKAGQPAHQRGCGQPDPRPEGRIADRRAPGASSFSNACSRRRVCRKAASTKPKSC